MESIRQMEMVYIAPIFKYFNYVFIFNHRYILIDEPQF